VMFLQTDPVQEPHPQGGMSGLLTPAQTLGWFDTKWDVSLPENFDDDYALQPEGVRSFKRFIDANYGRIPDDREELWLAHRNYLINAMRLVDAQFMKILEVMDSEELWENTVVIYTSDHGEMNGAHRMTQKGAIPFDEAAIVNLTVVAPGGPKGEQTRAVGSHLDLAPTLLEFAGLSVDEIEVRYPQLKGRSLKSAIFDVGEPGPRGSVEEPGEGALICWDGLHALDVRWGLSGALQALTDMSGDAPDPSVSRRGVLERAGEHFGAPDFSKRGFFRALVDGRHKLVRWFSPQEYANPSTLEALFALSDLALYDLVADPGELENLASPEHPDYDEGLIASMLAKLHALVSWELGEDEAPFELDVFGTREVKYRWDEGE